MNVVKTDIVSLNLTTLFRGLDSSSVNLEVLKKKFETELEKPELVSLDFPFQYHVFNLKTHKYQITVEDQRLIVEDRNGVRPSESELIARTSGIVQTGFSAVELVAYGFNYVVRFQTSPEYDFPRNAKHLYASDFLKDVKVLGFDSAMRYERENVVYQAQISHVGPQVLGLNFNAHRDAKSLPASGILISEFAAGWSELQALMSKLQ